MSLKVGEEVKRWTAKRESALVMEIIQGKTTAANDPMIRNTSRAGKVRYNALEAIYLRSVEMLTTEMKRQVFMKLRAENYRASLRLEGLVPRSADAKKAAAKPPAAPKTKHGR